MCMGSFKSPHRGSGDWTYGLTSLSEKTQMSKTQNPRTQKQAGDQQIFDFTKKSELNP